MCVHLWHHLDVNSNNEVVDLNMVRNNRHFMHNILEFQFMGILEHVQVDTPKNFIDLSFDVLESTIMICFKITCELNIILNKRKKKCDGVDPNMDGNHCNIS